MTDGHTHLTSPLNARIIRGGGRRRANSKPSIFAILEDLEGRLGDSLFSGLTTAGLMETVSSIIDRMIEERRGSNVL